MFLTCLIMIVIIIVGYVYYHFKKSFNYWKLRRVPHLTPTFPFGNMGEVLTRRKCMGDKILEIYNELKSKGCKFAGLYFFTRKSFLVMDPNLVKSILCTDFHHFHDRGIFYDEENDPVSAHLFSLSGKKWKILRAKLTPAFTAGKVKFMFSCVEKCANEMLNLIDKENNCYCQIEIKDLLARYTTDVIGSCAFGLECNSLINPTAEFRRMGKRAFTQTIFDTFKMIIIRGYPSLAKILRFSVFAPVVSKFFKRVVEETIDYREKNNIIRSDFLQLLIRLKNGDSLDDDDCQKRDRNLGNRLTINEIAAQAFIFFLAGFETTSTTMSFALLELALNEEIQERARNEINIVLNRYENKVCYESVIELHYLDCILSESLRKYPPAPVYLRKCTENYKVNGTNVIIEKGLSVLIPAIGLHRDPEYFPDPNKFDPERFNESNKHKIKDFTYIPFGDGPRICIGMRFAMVQAKLALMLLLRDYKLTLNNRTRYPVEIETNGIVYTTKGGIWINFEKYSP